MLSRFALISLTSISLCAFAQSPALDPIKAVKQISAKCEAAKEYILEGELEVAGQRGSAPGKILTKANVTLAVSPQGKYLLRLAPEDKNEYVLIFQRPEDLGLRPETQTIHGRRNWDAR